MTIKRHTKAKPDSLPAITPKQYETAWRDSGLKPADWCNLIGVTYQHHRAMVTGRYPVGRHTGRHLTSLRRLRDLKASLQNLEARIDAAGVRKQVDAVCVGGIWRFC